MPRATVVMATYNWAPVLPFSIGSVLDQTFTDFELLVIGDGCTDESADVVGAIGDPRVRWQNLEVNTGHQWGPNNAGLAQARGEIVAYLGHDDLWLPAHLETLVGVLDAGAEVAHDHALMVTAGQPLELFPPEGWTYEPGRWIPPTTLAHRRDLAVSVGGWRGPAETGGLDPEADLCQRLSTTGDIRLAPGLSSVKLSAASRHHVYRERPHHEQQYWLGRIRSAADPEADIRAALDEPYALASQRPSRWTSQWERARWSIRARWRRRRGRPTATAVERNQLRRRYKGLEP